VSIIAQFSLVENTQETPPITYKVNIAGITASFAGDQLFTLPTTGGQISIAGSNLGLDDILDDSSESVELYGTDSADIVCSNGVVSGNGTQLNCTAGPGVGVKGLRVRICRETYFLPAIFVYQSPIISYVVGRSLHEIEIQGNNFGPGRDFDNVTDYIFVQKQTCAVQSVDHKIIRCVLPEKFVTDDLYYIEMSIGGVRLLQPYQFKYLCNNPDQPDSCKEPAALTPAMKGGIAVGVIVFVAIIVVLAAIVFQLRRRVNMLIDEVKIRKAREYEMMTSDTEDRNTHSLTEV